MDQELVTKGIAVGVGLLAGRELKRRNGINHKALGVPTHLAIGQAAVAVANHIGGTMTTEDGVEVAIAIEVVYQAGKSVVHAGKLGVRAARGLGRLLGRIF